MSERNSFPDVPDAFWEALAAAESEPVGKVLDILALKDLVALELDLAAHESDSKEDAVRAREYCALARSAEEPMRAHLWLRRAMVAWKDFMLWDDSILGGQERDKRREGGRNTRKLPADATLLSELEKIMASRRCSEKEAKSVMRTRYCKPEGVTPQGLGKAINRAKKDALKNQKLA